MKLSLLTSVRSYLFDMEANEVMAGGNGIIINMDEFGASPGELTVPLQWPKQQIQFYEVLFFQTLIIFNGQTARQFQ